MRKPVMKTSIIHILLLLCFLAVSACSPAVDPATTSEENMAPAVSVSDAGEELAAPQPALTDSAGPSVPPLPPEPVVEGQGPAPVAETSQILEEKLPAEEPVSAGAAIVAPVPAEEAGSPLADDEILDLLGEDSVAPMVAQPDIPQQLRPPGIPVVRPGRVTRMTSAVEQGLLSSEPPVSIPQKEPRRPPQLLPEAEPEPDIIYIVPFVAVMVPKQASARIFDQFVDLMIEQGQSLGLQFVILKGGLASVSPAWSAARKYITGEVYAYVEDSGCCSTDMRARARIVYRTPYRETPGFEYEYPVSRFFDHDRSTIETERMRLADEIAAKLVEELVPVLQKK